MFKKVSLVVVALLVTASLANAVMVSATGTATGDGYVALTSDGTMSNFAAGPDNPTDVAPSSKSGTAQEFMDGGLATGLLANGEVWSIGTLGAYPITGNFLTADVLLDVVVGTSSTTSVLNAYTLTEVVTGGTWYRDYEDRLIENFNQMGANLVSAFIDATTFEQTNFASAQLLGDKNLTGSSNETVLISETFVPVPEPATMALLGLGGLLLRKRKA